MEWIVADCTMPKFTVPESKGKSKTWGKRAKKMDMKKAVKLYKVPKITLQKLVHG